MRYYKIIFSALLALFSAATLVACEQEVPRQMSAPVAASGPPPPLEMAPSLRSTGAAPASARMMIQPTPPASGDKFPAAEANRWTSAAEQPVSTVSLDVSKAGYAIVRRFLREGRMPPIDAVRGDDMVNYFPYDYPAAKDKARPFNLTTTVVPSPWTKGASLVHIALKGWDAIQATRPRANLTFLLDVSGSMQPQDRLPLVQKALHQFAPSLRADDTVSIVSYANGVQVVLEPTKGSELAKIMAAVDSLGAGGGTSGGAGLQTAYAQAESNFAPDAVNRIILATDGDFNLGETNPRQLEQLIAGKRKLGIYLTILGVGTDNLNDSLMQRLAHAGNGQAAYLDSVLEARKVFVEDLGSTMTPIADDTKMQVEFNPAKVAEYRLIGYETRQLQRADFLDDGVAGGQIGAGHAVTAIYEVLPVGSGVHHIQPLRYQQPTSTRPSEETAFVHIRYRLPGHKDSRDIEQGITKANAAPSLEAASNDVRFSVAVAGFAQLLRHDGAVSNWSFDQAADLADGARGKDAFGWRAELVQLIRAAKGLAG